RGQKFHGLRRIHLNNSVEDAAYCSEQLGSELFRSAGIPAPRVTRAIVTLNGRKLGLYVLKEGFTEDFLSCYFTTIGGNLFEPGEGHDVNQRLKRASLRPSSHGRAELKKLAQACREEDLNLRWQKFEKTLDLDRFIRFMALEVMLSHRDGYCLARNNFRLYQDVASGKMIFFPAGMDQLFGVSELPWRPEMAGLVARSVLETPEGQERYAHEFRALFNGLFNPEKLAERIDQLVEPLSSRLEPADLKAVREEATGLQSRVLKRYRFLATQLNEPPRSALVFESGAAPLIGWIPTDAPRAGQMQHTIGPDGIDSLYIRAQSDAFPSWRLNTRLQAGRYRFEGRVRVAGVEPLSFGGHPGAGLRIAGHPRESENLVGTAGWQLLSTEFRIEGNVGEVDLICELRARSGEVWFDYGSLRLVKLE
ncbi:MAG TPA: CotH kinase family protein, partial [Patescibacteria group bacterium]|nr:CotH kinase family protein [Patescibacteria group bacterium]